MNDQNTINAFNYIVQFYNAENIEQANEYAINLINIMNINMAQLYIMINNSGNEVYNQYARDYVFGYAEYDNEMVEMNNIINKLNDMDVED